jgi:hypothetical protein
MALKPIIVRSGALANTYGHCVNSAAFESAPVKQRADTHPLRKTKRRPPDSKLLPK